jgi:hypothetical protein
MVLHWHSVEDCDNWRLVFSGQRSWRCDLEHIHVARWIRHEGLRHWPHIHHLTRFEELQVALCVDITDGACW